MKIEKISDSSYKIYIFNKKIENDDIINSVKELINNLQTFLKLKGYYKVYTFNRVCGLFLHIVKIDDSYYNNSLDLKIIVDNTSDIYFKSSDYFSICDLEPVRYYMGKYYGTINNSDLNIINRIEFGEFVFGSDMIDSILDSGIVI